MQNEINALNDVAVDLGITVKACNLRIAEINDEAGTFQSPSNGTEIGQLEDLRQACQQSIWDIQIMVSRLENAPEIAF